MDEVEEATGSQGDESEAGGANAGGNAGESSLEGMSLEEAVAALAAAEKTADTETEETVVDEEDETSETKTVDKAKKDASEKVVFTPEQQEVLERRIAKEVAKTRTLEKRMEEIQQELDQSRKAKGSGDSTTTPLFEMNEKQLSDLAERSEKMLEFCSKNWDGTVDPDHPDKGGYTAEQIRTAYTTYTKMLRDIPQARQALAERAQVDAYVAQQYPDVAPGGEKDAMFQEFKQTMGQQFARLPHGRLMFAHMLLGEQVEQIRRKKATEKQTTATRREEPPKLPIGSRAVGKVGSTTGAAGAAAGKKSLDLGRLIASGGDIQTAVEVLAASGF